MSGRDARCRKVTARDVGFGWFPFRLWHGMALDAWLRLMKGHWGKVSPSKYPMVASIFVMTTINQGRKWISRAFYERDLDAVRISPDPVFVIGHWRSGTTWLHQTLIADPQFAAPTAMACFNPEGFLVGRTLLARVNRMFFPAKRPMDNVSVSMDSAEEDEHAIMLSGAFSQYRQSLLPCDVVSGSQLRVEDMPPTEAAFWRIAWIRFLRRVQLINPGRRLVLKSPTHTARIKEILRLFPEARFIHIVRDPYKVFASRRKMGLAMRAVQSLQARVPVQPVLDEAIIERFLSLDAAFEAQKDAIPEGHIVTLRYEDLKADPMATLRRIYETLDLGGFEAVAPVFEARFAEGRSYRPNRFSLEPEAVEMIDANWGAFFDRYGYKRMAERGENRA